MAERIDNEALNAVLSQISSEIENKRDAYNRALRRLEEGFWLKFLRSQGVGTGILTGSPQTQLEVLKAFRLGILIGSERIDLEDIFRAASIDYYDRTSRRDLPDRPIDTQGGHEIRP